jgi:phage virion morphogenesis protein
VADYSIRLEGDTRRLLKKIRSFAEIDRKKINAALGDVARESTLERFKQGKEPTGKRWQTSIRAAAEGGKTLIKTAQLRNSIRTKSDASGFAVGTNVKYGATHQFGEKGRTIRAKKAKYLHFKVGDQWAKKKSVKVSIPARPYLGLSDEDMQEIKATVEDFIARED